MTAGKGGAPKVPKKAKQGWVAGPPVDPSKHMIEAATKEPHMLKPLLAQHATQQVCLKLRYLKSLSLQTMVGKLKPQSAQPVPQNERKHKTPGMNINISKNGMEGRYDFTAAVLPHNVQVKKTFRQELLEQVWTIRIVLTRAKPSSSD